jgi:hypothetical protein
MDVFGDSCKEKNGKTGIKFSFWRRSRAYTTGEENKKEKD